MGQIESAIDAARRSGHGKSGPWTFDVTGGFGILTHYGTGIFRINLQTGAGEVGAGAWGSVSNQTGIRKAAQHLSNVLGGQVSIKSLAKKEIIAARERARSKGEAFSNPKRLAAGHSLLDDGKIYCAWQGVQAPPVITHSGVKCSFCGKTVQSMHGPSKNPGGRRLPAGSGWTMAITDSFDYPTVSLKGPKGEVEYVQFTDEDPEKWAHGHRVPPKVKRLAALMLKHRAVPKFFNNPKKRKTKKNPVPSYALLLRQALAKGHPFDEAEDIANRQLQQAAVFLSVPYTESRRRNPASGPTRIYGRTEKIFMTKTEGKYKGQRFVHSFKPGVEQIGLPRGTVLKFPGGKTSRVTTKSVLMTGKKDIWGNYPA
jgi:hypothetical protein